MEPLKTSVRFLEVPISQNFEKCVILIAINADNLLRGNNVI